MASGAQEQAHRHPWRRGGPAQRRSAISGRDEARGEAWELHRVRAVLERVKIGREVKRRGGVHGAELSSELNHYSGKGILRKGSFPWLTEASTGYARWRRSFGRDGASSGKLERPEQLTLARRWCGRWRRRARARALLLVRESKIGESTGESVVHVEV